MDALRKTTHFSALSTGDLDAGSCKAPLTQPVGVRLNPANLSKTIALPAGVMIEGCKIYPMVTDDLYTAPTAGAVSIGKTGALTRYAAAKSASAFSSAAAANQEATTEMTEIIFTANAALDGDVLVVLNVTPMVEDA